MAALEYRLRPLFSVDPTEPVTLRQVFFHKNSVRYYLDHQAAKGRYFHVSSVRSQGTAQGRSLWRRLIDRDIFDKTSVLGYGPRR